MLLLSWTLMRCHSHAHILSLAKRIGQIVLSLSGERFGNVLLCPSCISPSQILLPPSLLLLLCKNGNGIILFFLTCYNSFINITYSMIILLKTKVCRKLLYTWKVRIFPLHTITINALFIAPTFFFMPSPLNAPFNNSPTFFFFFFEKKTICTVTRYEFS